MNDDDLSSDYTKKENITASLDLPVQEDLQTEKQVSISPKTVIESIEPEYIQGTSSTETKDLKQYGLTRPKKVIRRAKFKND
ncbi:MAG TPA: hypothetical protein VEK32_04270 [Thermodesulfobacteriota bacterium]|nr:hypothetical protein [Thermodesulfobacteriota bacterium]